MQTTNRRSGTTDLEVFAHLLHRYRQVSHGQTEQKWLLLEAAHVMGQRHFKPHLKVHIRMLVLAWNTNDLPEVSGQLFRICLVPLGHLLGRLPIGNPGRANVGAFKPMDLSPELLHTVEQSRAMLAHPNHSV